MAAIQLYHWILMYISHGCFKVLSDDSIWAISWSLSVDCFLLIVGHFFLPLLMSYIGCVCHIPHMHLSWGVLGVLVSPAAVKKSDKKTLTCGRFCIFYHFFWDENSTGLMSPGASCLFTLEFSSFRFLVVLHWVFFP